MAAQKWIVFFTFLVLFAFMAMASEVNICERERGNINCPPEKIIQVLQASYGRHDRETCPDLDQYMIDTNCHAENSRAIVEATCENKHDCELFANNSVFGDPCFGTYKYLMVRYQCVDSIVNICEHERRNISCSPGKVIDILQASYGRQNRDTCPDLDQYMDDTNCHAGNSRAIVEATCGYKPSCELFANNSVFGDPCFGTYKYLMVRYQCVDHPVRVFFLCQFARGTLSCPAGKVIKLQQASYGRHDNTTCPHDNMSDTNCHSGNTHTIVEEKCHNKQSCELFADNSVFGDPCPGTHKYLRVMYECIDFFVVCQGTSGTIICPWGKTIKVLSASYGRHDSVTCLNDNMSDTNCHSENTHTIVDEQCRFQPICELYADNSVFGDPCPGTHKYLRVLHECNDVL